nr:RDD family protein [Zhihengliuella flava]
MNLVNASAGKRLGAWLLDSVPVMIVSIIFGAVLAPQLAQVAAAPEVIGQMMGSYVLYLVICLGYGVFLWWWEATSGKTVGNVLMGLRTANEDGFAPGWGKTIIRRLLIGVANVVPVLGPVLMVVSNVWDPNHQRQGWHDKMARTLVMDVRAGRDPLTTGGLFGPESFAPGYLPTAPAYPGSPQDADAGFTGVINSVPEPQVAAPAPQRPAQQAPSGQPADAVPSPQDARPAQPSATARAQRNIPEAPVEPVRAEPAEPVVHEEPFHPDDDVEHTQFREAASVRARLVFDDGQVHVLDESLLIGRNPAAAEGEEIADTLSMADIGRSMSKTHVLVQASTSGIWVTDRNSTNGSAITDAGGNRRQLTAGQPMQASMGETVYMGDRYFKVERA